MPKSYTRSFLASLLVIIACFSLLANCKTDKEEAPTTRLLCSNCKSHMRRLSMAKSTPSRRLCPVTCKKDKQGITSCNMTSRRLLEANDRRLCGCSSLANGGVHCGFHPPSAKRRLCPVTCHVDENGIKLCTMTSLQPQVARRLCQC